MQLDQVQKIVIDFEIIGSLAADGAAPGLQGGSGLQRYSDEAVEIEGLVVRAMLRPHGADDTCLEELADQGNVKGRLVAVVSN